MKHNLQKKVSLILLFLFHVLSGSVKASHTMGGDLTYQCLGGNVYKVTIKFYRDCIGSPAPASPQVDINSPSCGMSLNVTCYPIPGTGQEVSPVCPTASTTCNGGSYTGIQEWIYEGTVTLPAQCPDWIFGYSQCCRNAAITTINSPNTNTFYVQATLNNTISPCNSSPTFSNIPVPFLCLGQQFCFNHGAYDPDGDSLAYQLIVPRQTPSTTVTYIAPYSATNPLNSSPSTNFNPVTGDICLTPQAMEVTVMAVLVNEYRNGVLIGSVERDLQLIVRNCTNNLPSLTGVNGTNNFTTTVCANQQNCFSIFSNDADNGQLLSVTWNFGITPATFNTSNAAHPVGTFCWTPTSADIGNSYTFTATVTDDACPYYGSQTYAYTVNVTGMSVNAGSDQNINCINLATVTATVAGGAGPVTYQWNTGQTTQSISVGAGTYIVTANNGGCNAMDTVVVTGTPPPVVTAGIDRQICKGGNVTLTAGGAVSYVWSPGNAPASTINVSPSINTIYTVTGTDANGCTATDAVQVTVNSLPVADAGPDADICLYSAAHLNASGGVSYSWSPGNIATASYNVSPSADQNYVVTVTDVNGCIDKDTVSVFVHSHPMVSLPSYHSCAGDTTVLDAGNAGLSYHWGTGDTTQTISVSHAGYYEVTVTNNYGCTMSAFSNVTYSSPISVTLQDAEFCNGDSVVFDAGNPGLTYTWMPNGETTRTINVRSQGIYSVQVTDNSGCTATSSADVIVHSVPAASFSALPACIGSPMYFAEHSFISNDTIAQWHWDFGDGDTTSTRVPVHTFDTTGHFQVVLTVTSNNGCVDTAMRTMDVLNLPKARFTAPNDCSGTPIHFTNTSSSQDGNITSTLWTFGDGQSSPDFSPSHQYTDSGQYVISLMTITSFGCMNSYADTVDVYAHPTVNIQLNDGCAGSPVLFSATSSGGNMNYNWSLGNGYTSTNPSFSFNFNTPGVYNVALSAVSTQGCSGSTTNQVTIHPAPVAGFAASDVCQSSATSFSNYSNIASGSITTYQWNFGDNQLSVQSNPSHTYSSSGNFNASLTITSDHGCVSTYARQIEVHPNPVVNFNAGMQGCSPVNAGFAETSSIQSGNIAGYMWDFGDGGVSTDRFPHHVYNSTGNYNVTLHVVSDMGCQSSYTRPNVIRVFPAPLTDFNADPMVTDMDMPFVHFQNTSQNFNSYQWTFGDGSVTSSEFSPTHTFSDTGTYTAMLVTVNNYGCRDTIMKKIEVKQKSSLFLPNTFTPNGDGNNDVFKAYYTNMDEIKVWIFDRWGKLLTSWDNLDGSWNGYYNGQKCQQDTYVYKVVAKSTDGKSSEWVGHVSIVN